MSLPREAELALTLLTVASELGSDVALGVARVLRAKRPELMPDPPGEEEPAGPKRPRRKAPR